MSFISPEFAIFFAIVVPIYFAIPFRFRWLYLLITSYFFYAYWNASYIILIVFSTFVDYLVGRRIARTDLSRIRQRQFLLSISMIINLGVLFTFKYFNFFSDSFATLFGTDPFVLDVLLPVGISFYTFQSMSYTIDIYRGKLEPELNFGVFATFVAFFPQLVAGPIERAENMLPQFKRKVHINYDRIVSGLRLMLWGAFKKVVIADRVAIYVNAVYNDASNHSGMTLLLATLFFTFQIYCDFSGYSDIAIGTARIMGFDLMENFRQPYLSRSIREFWRRWHISLSTWFRDYLYIPLGGSRVSFGRMLLNLMIVFVVSGLWHGANWTFVIWGALHGGYLVIETILSRLFKVNIPVFLRILITFFLVYFAWIFFRANSLDDAIYIASHLFDLSQGFALEDIAAPFTGMIFDATIELAIAMALIVILFVVEILHTQINIFQRFKMSPIVVRWATYYVLITAILLSYGVALYTNTTINEFIYFQF